MPIGFLSDRMESIRIRIGAALLEIGELEQRMSEARQRLADAYMEFGEALRTPLPPGTDSIEDVA